MAKIHAVTCDERKPWQVHFSLVINRSNLHESNLIFSILNNITFVLLANYDLKPQLWHFVIWKGIALYSPLKKRIIHLLFYSVEVGYSNIWVLVVVSDWLVAGFLPISKVTPKLIALLSYQNKLLLAVPSLGRHSDVLQHPITLIIKSAVMLRNFSFIIVNFAVCVLQLDSLKVTVPT